MRLRTAALHGVLLLLLCGSPLRADDAPAPPAPDAGLSVERIVGGPPIHAALPDWSWRPGHAELVRVLRDKESERLVGLDPLSGVERTLLDLKALEALVPEPGAGEDGIGRGGPGRLLWSADGSSLCALVNGERVAVNLAAGAPRRLTRGGARRSDVQLSPDGRFLSYASADAFVVVPTSGEEPRAWPHAAPEAQRGRLDWLYPEELDLQHAAWWAPDGSALVVLTLDQAGVPVYRVPDALDLQGKAREMRYPRPGERNPRPSLQVLTSGLPAERPPVDLDLGTPEPEYVVRVAWTPDARRVLVVTLDRAQQHLTLRACDPRTGSGTVLLVERDAAWIEPPPAPRFEGPRTLLWRGVDGAWTAHLLDARDPGRVEASVRLTPPHLLVGGLLTAQLRPAPEAPQGWRGAALVAGAPPGSRQASVWRVQVPDLTAQPWLADAAQALDVDLDDTGALALVRRSTLLVPPLQEVRRADDATLVRALGDARNAAYSALDLPEVEEGATPVEGGQILWRLWKPKGSLEGRRLPLVVTVYGGPGSRTVEDRFGGGPYWPALLVQRGFLVLQADGRGTGGQGPAFERRVRGRLGMLELDDQVRAVQAVAGRPYVDAARVGVFGWSYGGTMVVNALLRRGDVFRAGVAVAAVTDWRLYDTIYTERYMGLPAANAAGYRETSALEHAKGLSGRLLLLHGLADDNVHPQNTQRLVEALLTEQKSGFDWLLYANRGHGLGGAGRDVFARALAWFERHLGVR